MQLIATLLSPQEGWQLLLPQLSWVPEQELFPLAQARAHTPPSHLTVEPWHDCLPMQATRQADNGGHAIVAPRQLSCPEHTTWHSNPAGHVTAALLWQEASPTQ